MAESPQDLSRMVSWFLPLTIQELDVEPDIEIVAASVASFVVAASRIVTPMSRADRLEFCRRVAAMSDGDVQSWMVEASLRSAEGDQDALAGTDPAIMTGIHLYGLILLNDEYLTPTEAESLRGDAVRLAEELLPRLAALPLE